MMKTYRIFLVSIIVFALGWSASAFALGEKNTTLTYKVTHRTAAGSLTTYTMYSIVAYSQRGYWLQRTTALQPDSTPLSITQTLLDDYTHEPLRYIMHRPAKMDRPESVIDLSLSHVGQNEILPFPLVAGSAAAVSLQLPAGTFETHRVEDTNRALWLSQQVPVLGVAKVETSEWTMELVRIADAAVDLLPQKPQKGGTVYLKK